MDIEKIEARRTKKLTSEEWENFTNIIDDTRWLFQPDTSTLRRQREKGTKLNKRRVSDVGTSMLNDYAAGVLSESITSGERWFEFHDSKKEPDIVEMLDGITKKTYDAINASNFNGEMYRDQISAGCDGTSCFYAERIDGKVVYQQVPYGSFVFEQDFQGRPNTVWIEKTTTVGALVDNFGIENVSTKTSDDYEAHPDKEIKIIMYCAPRTERDTSKNDKANKPYQFVTYEKDEKHMLDEGGTDAQKFLIYRVKRVNNETLGRGPCINTVCTMAAVERASKDMQRAMRAGFVPLLGVPASLGQNGFRFVHTEESSMLVYNDTGFANPPQTMNPNINADFGQAFLEWMITQMRQLFFLDYFNPLQNRRNMTLGEAKERVSKAQQMVDQIVGPFKEERLDPVLQWTFILVGEGGEFAVWGSW
jgi:hypothetical protein